MSNKDYENEIKDWTKLLAGNAGENEAFVNEFIEMMNGSEKIKKEYIYRIWNSSIRDPFL